MLEVECGFDSDYYRTGQDELELSGPTLSIRVEQVGRVVPAERKSGPCDALVDTGADKSCIDIDLAKKLELEICDTQTVNGVHGPQQTDYYAALIDIPGLSCVRIMHLAGLPLARSSFPHEFLIGRDILRWFVLIYEGDTGRVVIRRRSQAEGER